MNVWVPGTPTSYSTKDEILWKEALRAQLPEGPSYTQERGLVMDFRLAELLRRGHPVDVDNLCEPVFSVLVNQKGWFGARRSNIHWWRASKRQGQLSGCRITIFLAEPPSIGTGKEVVFNGHYAGHLPVSATDSAMSEWIRKTKDAKGGIQREFYEVLLRFDDAGINIGEIATGKTKSVIDSLYPILGGEAGSPEDWRIVTLQVEKDKGRSGCEGVEIGVWKTD